VYFPWAMIDTRKFTTENGHGNQQIDEAENFWTICLDKFNNKFPCFSSNEIN